MPNLTFGTAALTARRRELENQVDSILGSVRNGAVACPKETKDIDFKEEAGRRRGRILEPGNIENPLAAAKLADEVACFANTPGGGALIVGVEDKTGNLLGTQLDVDWLRQKIYSAIDVAPDIQARVVEGQRLLIIYVPEAIELIPNSVGHLRWRVEDSCLQVDRARWWQHRQATQEVDFFAQASQEQPEDVSAGAMRLARRWSSESRVSDGVPPSELTDQQLLIQWGALRTDGALTEAASLLFVPHERSYLEITVFDAPGGSAENRLIADPSTSLLEQIDFVERSLQLLNSESTLPEGFAHKAFRKIPPLAVREAILNGVIHRDWDRSELIEIRWTNADSELEVRSPGGFVDGISEKNILSDRRSRYPALADLFRAIGLVDRQGVIGRMYQSMITQGHRPPQICQVAGPSVQCVLAGGEPKVEVVNLISQIVPVYCRTDWRIAILLHELLNRPYVSVEKLASALQSPTGMTDEAERTLESASQATVRGKPLIAPYKKVWVLGEEAFGILSELLPYCSTDPANLGGVIDQWLAGFPAITSGDVMHLARISRGTATKALSHWAEEGTIARKGQGRSTRFERTTD